LQPDRPSLSVVVASYNSRDTIAQCLESLQRQGTHHTFEILVVDSSTDGTEQWVQQRFPNVKLLHKEQRLFAGDARNVGIAVARAPVIAFLDADCTVENNWVDEILAAQASGHAIVTGVIDNGSRASAIAWTYYFCEFNLWLPNRKARMVPESAGCCLTIEREVFSRYGPFLTGTYCSDTAFHWKLQRDGQSAFFSPHIRVYHHTSGSLISLLKHLYFHRRYFARVKCSEKRLTPAGRFVELALLPATPALLTGATVLRLRHCLSYLPIFIGVSPLVFLGFVARALGEAAGYLRPQPQK
jgi:GT2 family glycosyltransferase